MQKNGYKGLEGGGNGQVLVMGTVSVWNNEKVLEMDRGDGFTTMPMYLMPLNCTLKMVKMVNFMLRVFCHSKINKCILREFQACICIFL